LYFPIKSYYANKRINTMWLEVNMRIETTKRPNVFFVLSHQEKVIITEYNSHKVTLMNYTPPTPAFNFDDECIDTIEHEQDQGTNQGGPEVQCSCMKEGRSVFPCLGIVQICKHLYLPELLEVHIHKRWEKKKIEEPALFDIPDVTVDTILSQIHTLKDSVLEANVTTLHLENINNSLMSLITQVKNSNKNITIDSGKNPLHATANYENPRYVPLYIKNKKKANMKKVASISSSSTNVILSNENDSHIDMNLENNEIIKSNQVMMKC